METSAHRYAFITLIVGITVIFFWLTAPFLIAVFWAIVLGIVFNPVNKYIKSKLKSSRLAAGLSLVIITMCMGVPLYFAGNIITKEVSTIYENLQSPNISERTLEINKTLARYPILAPLTNKIESLSQETFQIGEYGSQWVLDNALNISGNILNLLLMGFIIVYVLFFILKDGTRLRDVVVQSLPFSNTHTEKLFKQFSSITRATLKGVFFVGVIEGIIAAILFYIVGIPGAILWGLAVTLVSVVPGVGTGIVWFPVVGYLLLAGLYWQALLVLGGGIATVIIVDNILRPRMIGRDTKLPDAFILLSTFGGIWMFGAAGLILGPLIAGLFVSVWAIYRTEYKK